MPTESRIHLAQGARTACGKDRERYSMALTSRLGEVTCRMCWIVITG